MKEMEMEKEKEMTAANCFDILDNLTKQSKQRQHAQPTIDNRQEQQQQQQDVLKWLSINLRHSLPMFLLCEHRFFAQIFCTCATTIEKKEREVEREREKVDKIVGSALWRSSPIADDNDALSRQSWKRLWPSAHCTPVPVSSLLRLLSRDKCRFQTPRIFISLLWLSGFALSPISLGFSLFFLSSILFFMPAVGRVQLIELEIFANAMTRHRHRHRHSGTCCIKDPKPPSGNLALDRHDFSTFA